MNYVLGNPVAPFTTYSTVFPNWVRVPSASFLINEADDTAGAGWCVNSSIVGLTMMNYGTAKGTGDISGVYFRIHCGGKIDSGTLTMTYAGDWITDGKAVPYSAWTWAGNFAFAKDPCNECACNVQLDSYVDIGSCPVDGATIQMGPGYNTLSSTSWPGGIYGTCAESPGLTNQVPWYQAMANDVKEIKYIYKRADKDVVAPGDTINYEIFYGRPGTGVLANLSITDTQPVYTHLVPSGTVYTTPDPGWAPDPGPPKRMRWSFSGLNTAGGPTGRIRFAVTVDWGQDPIFDPNAGTVAAPEGEFLFNSAHMSWSPDASCSSGMTSNAPSTVAKRFLVWKIGDQDVLLAPRVGQPDDEIIYEIFLKNLSSSKTWFKVNVWDTVPPLLDTWQPNMGFYDPCLGWTMTPSGCAAAAPGKFLSGGKNPDTVLTWRLEMPPGATIALRWKAKLKTSAAPQDVILNEASVRSDGDPYRIDGTGDSQRTKVVKHVATVVLRTTFISYVGWAGDDTQWFGGCVTPLYFISFYPLNKACDFALYKRWCCPDAQCDPACTVHTADGVSPQINILAGTCTGGPLADWEVGCKVERSPARYVPTPHRDGTQPGTPYNYLHKMVSNAPMVWELSMCLEKDNQDADTYAGTSTLTFMGFISYTYLRRNPNSSPDPALLNDGAHIINTDPNSPTTVYVFGWDALTRTWQLEQFKDIYNESQWAFIPPQPNHYRILSSDTQIIVHKAYVGIPRGGAYNDMGTLAPNKENGGLISPVDPTTGAALQPANFYLLAGHLDRNAAIVGTVRDAAGGANAVYEIWQYSPFDKAAPNPNPYNVSNELVGAAGYWFLKATHQVEHDFIPGGTDPANPNPHVYYGGYDASVFTDTYKLYKVKLLSGGPIQVYTGRDIITRYSGGAMMHATKWLPGVAKGTQSGVKYWLHVPNPNHGGCPAVHVVDVFVPKANTIVNLSSSQGYTSTFTSDLAPVGGDQAIVWRDLPDPGKAPARVNWNIEVQDLAGTVSNPGNVISQYIECNIGEKFYTAPFLQRGVYYDIIVPPVVYSGEDFWMTIVVIDSGGGTKTDYCGTNFFTSTDPLAQVTDPTVNSPGPLGGVTYDWSASKTCTDGSDDDGVKVFVQVNFTTLGLQTLVAQDLVDGTIIGLATIMVVGADVKLFKEPRFAVQASGDTVTFKVCWSNYSSATAFNFTVTDAVPEGTDYVPDPASAALCGSTAPVNLTLAYSVSTSPIMPSSFITTGASPPATTRWLRWTVDMAGVYTTGCFCYRVRVR